MTGYLPPLQVESKLGNHKHVDAADGNIVIGHNQADADAPLIGKTANLRIKDGKLYADIVGINEAGLDVIKQFPYYSPDMMTEPPELLGVSLLGQTPPHFKFPPLTDYEPVKEKGYFKYVNVPIFEKTERKPNENSKESFSFNDKWIHAVKNQFDLDKEKSVKARFSKLNQANRANFALPLTQKGIEMPDEIITDEVGEEEAVADDSTAAVLGQIVTVLEGFGDKLNMLVDAMAPAAPESEAAAELGTEFAEDEEDKEKEAEFADEDTEKKDDEKKEEKVEAARFARMKRELKAELNAERDSKAHEAFIVTSCNKLHSDGKIGNVNDAIAKFSRMDANDAEKEIAYYEASAPLRHLAKAKSDTPKEDNKAVFSRATNELYTNDIALAAYGGVDGIKEMLNGLTDKQREAVVAKFKK